MTPFETKLTEILLTVWQDGKDEPYEMRTDLHRNAVTEAITAIQSLIAEVLGEDEEMITKPAGAGDDQYNDYINGQNHLRAELRSKFGLEGKDE